MSIETTSHARRFTSMWCAIASCERPVDGNVGGPYCWTHRRTFRFSATLNDGLTEFLGTAGGSMRPSRFNASDVREAGELFAQGLSKLFGAAFGSTVTVSPQPITPTSANGYKAWHVSFRWQEDEGERMGHAAMDETEDLGDEYNDDEGDEDD